MQRRLVLLSALLAGSALATFACSSCSTDGNQVLAVDAGSDVKVVAMDSGGSPDTGSTPDAGGMDTGTPTDSGMRTDSGTDAGYVTVQFDPNGTGNPDAIYWDDAKQTLYIVDDNHNQIWTYTDAQGLQKYATVPDNPALDDAGRTKLNGVTELADGTLVVTRFGYGSGGAIYTVSPDGGTSTVPNVPAARKRIEVTVDNATGTIYSDSFTGGGGTAPAGAIEIVNLTTGTTTYASGFGKTVGLLVQGKNILVADQTNNVIVAVPTDGTQIADGGVGLAEGGAFPVYAALPSPDQLSAGPNGSIFTDQFQPSTDGGGPQVRQVSADGGVTVLFPTVSFTSLSDVKYDKTNHRLFVVDSNGTTVRTIKIFPVSP